MCHYRCILNAAVGICALRNIHYYYVCYHCTSVCNTSSLSSSCSEELLDCYCNIFLFENGLYTCGIGLVVYDTMGYINTVNQTAEASIANSIRDVQNSDSYNDRNGAVSQCNPSIVIRHVSI